MHSDTSMK